MPKDVWLWNGFLMGFIWFCFFILYLYLFRWNPEGHNICRANDFDPWTTTFIRVVLGASLGTWFSQCFRMLFSWVENRGSRARVPSHASILLMISTIQALCIFMHCSGIFESPICTNIYGTRMPFFLYWEWCSTVPTILFLVVSPDPGGKRFEYAEKFLQLLGGVSLISLFAMSMNIPSNIANHALFLFANVAMCVAMIWLVVIAIKLSPEASDRFNLEFRRNGGDSNLVAREYTESVRTCNFRLSLAWLLFVLFSVFPVLHYLCMINLMSGDTHIVIVYLFSYLAKSCTAQAIFDFHTEVVDPNRFIVLEERANADVKRNAFIRYIFHEVRVPFNSISLGLQLLDGRIPQVDVLNMMKDAANCMSETLNDALTLQKIEDGFLALELKEFSVYEMVTHVISNFR